MIGLDPGLRNTGWGIIQIAGNRLQHLANGTVRSRPSDPLAQRLQQLYAGLDAIIADWTPDSAAAETTFVNKNPDATLKLGQARGVVLLAPANHGLAVAEYAPNQVKKTVVGVGHADKGQIHAMVSHLLPGCIIDSADAADALAVAICHAHWADRQWPTAPTAKRQPTRDRRSRTGGAGS
ncbi:MAG TPA: crossover junction endodeoxyribonuclease RuvC [Alphaproteobacteria bacterium]|nr:crossover junction endodeoxyribonuclease RuvC [Alphaproteobacteria bacterium]